MSIIFKRILLKLSGEALAGKQNFGVESSRIHQIAEEIKDVHALGVEIAIVMGGGNFFRGVAEQARDMDRVSADHMGTLATILNATQVDGIYEADPKLVKDPAFFDKITYLDFLKRGLKVMDSTAISMCRDNSLPIVIFNLNKHGNIRRVVTGEKVGSLVTA